MSIGRSERASAISVGLPFRSQWPRWDYSTDDKDRKHASFLYRGPKDVNITSTATLHKPVDYFLAGDKRDYGKGRASGRLLRHIFRE